MKAELVPLEGKYYGTQVVVTTDNGVEYQFTLWNSADFKPSRRELAMWGEGEFETHDSHFESEETYKLACHLIDLLNASEGANRNV